MSRDPVYLRNLRAMRICGKDSLKVSHHPDDFCDHRHCGGESILVLVYQVISKCHVIKGVYEFMNGNRLWKVTALPGSVTMHIVVVEIYSL